jgi:hypothetical protein
MDPHNIKVKPDFLIIGAQKCGTTWLWEMLRQHPGTDLRNRKEIHFFSSSKNYRKGKEWYYQHFRRADSDRVIGEASTDYFYNHVLIDNLTRDPELPEVPELIHQELPGARIILILRDPVKRAVSAYFHHLQRRRFPPGMGIFEAARINPRLRIIERGYYSRYLEKWLERYPGDKMLCLIFEKHVLVSPELTLKTLYSFLKLEETFSPRNFRQVRNERWGSTHIWLNYYLGPWYGFVYRQLKKSFFSEQIDRIDKIVGSPNIEIQEKDLIKLKEIYRSERIGVERLLNIEIPEWEN